jgi:transposase
MPKIIPLREVEPNEMLELQRLSKKGSAFEARRARFILALTNPLGLRPNQIGAAHGFSVSTSSNLRNRFNAMGPEGCSYQFNELASLGRCKLSFEAQERGVAIAKTEALTLAGVMARLKQEKLVPKNETNGRYALADTLKRAGMSFQRTRYSLKKARPPAL